MLRAIAPNDLHLEWERVRAGLVEVKKATSDDWLPEDVYMSIRQGGAVLWTGEDEGGGYLGFVVLKLVPSWHAATLEIWCAYSASNTPLLARFWPEIQAIGKNAGANVIGFGSARPEWQQVATRLGFKPKQTHYEFSL